MGTYYKKGIILSDACQVASIQRLRSGERQLNKLTLDSAEKLYLFQLELEQKQLDNGGGEQ
ncbi:hypothetical protein [Staphylococcus epidermidis]|uniref:hypothetical protein n=1 Tax=Staphylococcus epidermidis TaxID=1282 RepID=UPI0007D9701C|nr:hypothetical protein [Staphylococcus epidermidis]MDI0104944.1 hypothetical protein [Staphylococcus epidermidis]OAO18687.1 hypothetical protein AXY35_10830 [Staphylococcus epidermidis]